VTRAFVRLAAAEQSLRQAVKHSAFVDAWSHAAIGPLLRGQHEGPAREAVTSARNGLELGTRVARVVELSARELQQAFQNLANELGEPVNTTKGNSPCR
jgi:hypothetical protein